MFNHQKFYKKEKKDNPLLQFLLAGVVAGAGTYLFLTKKGKSTCSTLKEHAIEIGKKLRTCTNTLTNRENNEYTQSRRPIGDEAFPGEGVSPAVSKAYGMIDHLKHSKGKEE